jgi:hypothetical protein
MGLGDHRAVVEREKREMPLINCKPRPPRPHLLFLFYYFAQYFICALNWWWFVSYERALFGDDLVNAHLGFNVIGCISFALFASPFMFLPYRYGQRMSPRERRNSTIVCIVQVFVLHDFPLWLMEFWMVWQWGWIHELQGISIILLTSTTAVGFFGVWLGYPWKMSKVLQTYFGSAAFNVAGDPTRSRIGGSGSVPRI